MQKNNKKLSVFGRKGQRNRKLAALSEPFLMYGYLADCSAQFL